MSEGNNIYNSSEYDIAIVGMACRFPGAQNLDQFWQNLVNGKESITFFSDEELLSSGIEPSLISNPHYVKAAPIINGPELFDNKFFGLAPMEATVLDPQQRVLLECAHEAMEHAGVVSGLDEQRIGVYTGSAMNTYFMNGGLQSKFNTDYIPTLIGNDKDFLSTRISYKLNLTGPSINVQTACSTSLVAVHLACQSLLSQECDVALAGAVSIKAPHKAGYLFQEGGVVSPDGHVRPFDAKANGTVFGSGAGMVVLKRMSDAVQAGDTIHAVIKGSAINNDGEDKSGYSAPSVNSQAGVITDAHFNADLSVDTISYIETHGSGTAVGDPIEVRALAKAFSEGSSEPGSCPIGSVKSNIGHLDVAAGIASLIKTVLALRNKKIPASINYSEPNPQIDFQKTPFYVNSETCTWEEDTRRAGVLSTGMGGTNAYVILEEPPEIESTVDQPTEKLLVWSAESENALDEATNNLEAFIRNRPEINLEDLAFTLQNGRRHYRNRRFIVCKNREQALAYFDHQSSKGLPSVELKNSFERSILFLFPGIGDQYVGMGLDLYQDNNTFKYHVDKCAEILAQHVDFDIRDVIYPQGIEQKSSENKKQGIDLAKMLGKAPDPYPESTNLLNQTIHSQVALFTIEYSLAQVWIEWGIKPEGFLGHSMGEYVAACLAGVFSLEDALRLIAIRAKLVNELPQGSMLAVTLSEEKLAPLLDENVSISLINGPELCVVAGASEHMQKFEELLRAREILYRPINNAHAFHSSMLDPIIDEYTRELGKIKLNPPEIPFISNVTGTWISNDEAVDPQYWARHANHTVRFDDALTELWSQQPDCVLIEMGPGKTLGVLATQHPGFKKAEDPVVLSSLRSDYENQSDTYYILNTVGQLWAIDVSIQWDKVFNQQNCRKVPAPTYPFERQRFWISQTKSDPKTGLKYSDLSKWFYAPSWKQTPLTTADSGDQTDRTFVVFENTSQLGTRLKDRLAKNGSNIICVTEGPEFKKTSGNNYSLNPRSEQDYLELFKDLDGMIDQPFDILHLWNFDPTNTSTGLDYFEKAQALGLYSLVNLAKALRKYEYNRKVKITLLANDLHSVNGADKISPEKATILGATVVIPQENTNIFCCCIDIDSIEEDTIENGILLDQLISDIYINHSESIVAYRGNQRYTQSFDRIGLSKPTDLAKRSSKSSLSLKENGVYLITGGLGQIGLILSEYLSKSVKAKIVLLGRSEFPARDEWTDWIENNSEDNAISLVISKIHELEKFGGEITIETADVSDLDEMTRVVEKVYHNIGEINGVFHAAGFIKEGAFKFIEEINSNHYTEHFSAKVYGTYVLHEIFKNKGIDFIMPTSTIASILGGLGHLVYAAANAFVDSFAISKSYSSGFPWLTINWDIWRLINTEKQMSQLGGITLAELGITAEEGKEVFDYILSPHYLNRIIISTGDLDKRIAQWVKLESNNTPTEHSSSGQGEDWSGDGMDAEKLEISIANLDDPPTTDTEKTVWKIWASVLGSHNIGIRQNFFELGGHSLLAVQVISMLRNTFEVKISIGDFFENATVFGICQKIDTKAIDLKSVLTEDEINMFMDDINKSKDQ